MQDINQLRKPQTVREFSTLGVELCTHAIPCPGIPGLNLEPDPTKAYCEFDISYAWPVRTAYGGAFHPGTLANSFRTMFNQVFNRAHRMKSYSEGKPEDSSSRDYIFGSIAGVELTDGRSLRIGLTGEKPAPAGGWKIQSAGEPHIHGAAVIHKKAEGAARVIGEHLGGRHKWAVSQEVLYSLLESGFVVERNDRAPAAVRATLDQHTPPDFKEAGLGYIPVLLEPETLCPEDLLDCYSFEERRITRDWHGQRVSVLKGGINGRVHFQGVGMVRYGAEREAQIQQLLATDPDRLVEEPDLTGFLATLKILGESSQNMLTNLPGAV